MFNVKKESEEYVMKMIRGHDMNALEIIEEVQKTLSFLGFNNIEPLKRNAKQNNSQGWDK